MRTVPETYAAVGAYRADLLPAGGPSAERLLEAADRVRRELDALLSITPSAIRVFDADGVIVRGNATVVAADTAEADSAPRTLRELWERDAPLFATTVAGARVPLEEHPVARALRGEYVRGETYIVHRGGAPCVVETFAGPVLDDAGRPCGALLPRAAAAAARVR